MDADGRFYTVHLTRIDLYLIQSNLLRPLTCTSAHTSSLAALPHLDMPVHPCFPLPGGLLPQTSPSGTNYPMVGVLSMCPPHHFSQFPTSGHLCRPAQTRFFAYLALHSLHTTLHTLLHT